jgi:hypothetical protein
MYGRLGTAPGGTDTVIVTARKNGADGAVTFTITGAATTGNDTTNEDSYVAGDLLSIKVVASTTSVAADLTLGFELTPTET